MLVYVQGRRVRSDFNAFLLVSPDRRRRGKASQYWQRLTCSCEKHLHITACFAPVQVSP